MKLFVKFMCVIAAFGWWWNLMLVMATVASKTDTWDSMMTLRAFGIVIFPLGCVLGFY
jgi:hypothetical protein